MTGLPPPKIPLVGSPKAPPYSSLCVTSPHLTAFPPDAIRCASVALPLPEAVIQRIELDNPEQPCRASIKLPKSDAFPNVAI